MSFSITVSFIVHAKGLCGALEEGSNEHLKANSLQWCINSASSSSLTYARPIFMMLACSKPHMVMEEKLRAT
jgi:hypothetical protein